MRKIIATIMLLTLFACETEQPILLPPTIKLDSPTDSYQVKVNKQITITPIYENVAEAGYFWTIEGDVISTEYVLKFTPEESATYYIKLEVVTPAGRAKKEIKLDVAPLLMPEISMIVPEGGFKSLIGTELKLEPTVTNMDETSKYKWMLGNDVIGEANSLAFKTDKMGRYELVFSAQNIDGVDTETIVVNVVGHSEFPFSWAVENTVFNASVGRDIYIEMFDVKNESDAKYHWTIGGQEVAVTETPQYVIRDKSQGRYSVAVTMKNSYVQPVTQEFDVNVCPAEGTYKRSATPSSKASCVMVYDFLPAPGQFVNEGYTANTIAEAIQVAQTKLCGENEMQLSLGGYGGYVVVGFDHSVENKIGADLQIKGNPFAGSSEPGIVYVMQDENGNSLPDDTWYELKGSETGKAETFRDFAITYYRPNTPTSPILWVDSHGGKGDIRQNEYHGNSYFPAWMNDEKYTLRGTILSSKTVVDGNGIWTNAAFGWGYVDNFSAVDCVSNIGDGLEKNGNYLKISNAIDHNGDAVALDYIDFVKVQTALNITAGWLGELSTEVIRINDAHLIK